MIALALAALIPAASIFATLAIREGNRTHRKNLEQESKA